MRGVIHRLLFLVPFVLPAWMLVWWIVNGASPGEFLFLLIAMPAAFVTAGVAALLVWLRPDVRERRAVTWTDAAWLGGAWLAWLVAGAIGGGYGMLALIAAGVVAVVAVVWLWRRLRAETVRRYEAATASGAAPGGSQRGAARSPGEGPDAGKVITIEQIPRTPPSAGGTGGH
ncbi:hypothetical protein GCM10011490_25620 [Pseudoclavibacter endophyticus]|uniref:Uncharacterized protein n=1 Tax=Pseudoclavibacter endophyticus TaxID=1778590 RepID=A0A6H9WHL3_9MICO|nr:hypothetical protein [Pseudoclavibacter endophyticus]KAB1647887.1 hypothetical protein F8O04_12785 [Pseudoclavibacter endophyticus]GGA73632.1 hypothetical protein GCM10011490_25620 [Pseudoclavibacter endophyticus]